MPLRPHPALILAEIDNTVPDQITGFLWFAGRADPVRLELDGDACPDLAGTRTVIVNPRPQPDAAALALDPLQTGRAGEMTLLWRRGRPAGDEGGGTGYLEWYSSANGRVVLESADLQVQTSDRRWTQDAAGEAAREQLSMEAMREHLRRFIARRTPAPSAEGTHPDDISEEEWETTLKESDRLSDAGMEVLEKYEDDPHLEYREAWLLGWDDSETYCPPGGDDEPGGCGGDSADFCRKNSGNDDDDDDFLCEDDPGDDPMEAEAEAMLEEDDESDGQLEQWLEGLERQRSHPLRRMVMDYVEAVEDHYEKVGLLLSENEGPASPGTVFINRAMQISGKLAGVLGEWHNDRMPRGMILAVTRRCLQWANEALAALAVLESTPPDRSFGTLRPGLFAIREAITDLRQELQFGAR